MSDVDTARAAQFALVSRLLLDSSSLDATVGAVFLAMLDDLDATWPLTPMAKAFTAIEPLPPDERERRIMAMLRADTTWYDAATNVLNVWYSGQLTRPGGSMVPAPPSAYLGALVWGLARTQASGLPGPFFGEWAYPPAPEASSVAAPRGGA